MPDLEMSTLRAQSSITARYVKCNLSSLNILPILVSSMTSVIPLITAPAIFVYMFSLTVTATISNHDQSQRPAQAS